MYKRQVLAILVINYRLAYENSMTISGVLKKMTIAIVRKARQDVKLFFKFYGFVSLLIIAGAVFIVPLYVDRATAMPIVVTTLIVSVILHILILAILYVPRKFYITTGAAVAFVVAALVFECFLFVKSSIENSV